MDDVRNGKRDTYLLSYKKSGSKYLYLNKCGHRNVLSKRQVWMSIFINYGLFTRSELNEIIFENCPMLGSHFCIDRSPTSQYIRLSLWTLLLNNASKTHFSKQTLLFSVCVCLCALPLIYWKVLQISETQLPKII
jgi:hypothetical protein